jgi:pyruvate,orthophosphate dikinase
MARAAGILTSRGGLASHAAVVARGWGIPAVVGAGGIEVRDGVVAIGDRVLRSGDVLTIDGSSGEVFEGAVPRSTTVVPEAATLLAWARELGIPIGEGGATAASNPPAVRKVVPDDCLVAIAIKGFATIDGLADAVLSTPDDVRPIVDQLSIDGLVDTSVGAYRVTDAGKARAATLLDAERERWGGEAANAALDAFVALDVRTKEVVTAWQMRDAQTINDHADAGYDAAVLERLGALHADAVAWIEPVAGSNPRLATYRIRLDRALDRVRSGDGRFVASPRVDSYHGIWFELHEDLIRLAGRTREGEVAAGRA